MSRNPVPVAPGRPGLGTGVYSYAEVAGLLRVTPERVRRWADGYTYQARYDRRQISPVLQTEREKLGVLTFEEMIELTYVRQFMKFEVPLKEIRAAAERLAQEVGPHPFASARWQVENRQLLRKTAEGWERPDVGQFVADFAESFARQVVVEEGRVRALRPPGYDDCILLDARVQFGAPVVSEHAVSTRAIYRLWHRERDLAPVADYFDLDPRFVASAVQFETEWRTAA